MSKKYSLPKTSSREFHTIIDSLITDGLLSIGKNNHNSNHNNFNSGQNGYDSILQILIPFDDISYAVQDNVVLAKFFNTPFVVPSKYR